MYTITLIQLILEKYIIKKNVWEKNKKNFLRENKNKIKINKLFLYTFSNLIYLFYFII